MNSSLFRLSGRNLPQKFGDKGQTFLSRAALGTEAFNGADARAGAVENMRHKGSISDTQSSLPQQSQGTLADNIGEKFPDLSQNHQSCGALADNLIGDESTLQRPGLVTQQSVKVNNAPQAEEAYLVA